MKKKTLDDYRAIISRFTTDERVLLRKRATDPFAEIDTDPFKTTGKPGDKYIYIAFRPDRVTKVILGPPAQVLEILDALETIVDVLPPPPVAPPEPPTHFPPPQPPPIPPTRDTSWRVPALLSLVAAFAALFNSPAKIEEAGAADSLAPFAKNAASHGSWQLYLPQTSSVEDCAATTTVVGEASPTISPSSPSSATSARVATPPFRRIAANVSSQPVGPDGKLAAVFAALAARCDQASTNSATVTLLTQNLAGVVPVLQTNPSRCPVLPRASVGSAGLNWPDSALVGNVEHNLRAVSFESGVLVLWVKDAAILAQSMAAKGSLITGISGWGTGSWDYTIRGDRIEIREVAAQ